jgi:NAD(P)-dependent dehydrogenase (short-subunit alcohol dehydrogenase family)
MSYDLREGHGRLVGRTALITGATRGLGRIIAEYLARDGANLILSGRIQPDVDRAVSELAAFGTSVSGFAAELKDVAQIHALMDAAFAQDPAPDILVNNAGMSIPQDFWECSDAEWDEQVNSNMRAPFVACQRAAKAWIPKGIRGRIVNVSTVGVWAAHHDRMVYNMAKAGIETMTRNMAFELGRYGISVNCVAPGAVPDKPGTYEELQGEHRTRANAGIPLGRVGNADDIAAVVRFFCLEESWWTTGQTLLVDGGMTAPMHLGGRSREDER